MYRQVGEVRYSRSAVPIITEIGPGQTTLIPVGTNGPGELSNGTFLFC